MKLTLIVSIWTLAGCATIKPYEKEYLLHPFMDDAALAPLTFDFSQKNCGRYERLSSLGGTASGGTSCPTCGG